jgi:hypothetical protein
LSGAWNDRAGMWRNRGGVQVADDLHHTAFALDLLDKVRYECPARFGVRYAWHKPPMLWLGGTVPRERSTSSTGCVVFRIVDTGFG